MSIEGQNKNIYLLTGKVHGGKTSYLARLLEVLQEKGQIVGGFISPGSFDSGERSGFMLQNIMKELDVVMATTSETEGWMKFRRFWFNPYAFELGREWILSGLAGGADVMVIDEVGPMELEGKGWSDCLELLTNSPTPIQLWTVRESVLDEVSGKWNIPGSNVIRIEHTKVAEIAEMIVEAVKN